MKEWREWKEELRKPKFDDYLICPECEGNNIISETQHLGSSLCECQTTCENCDHKDYWAYGFYKSKS